MDWGGLAQAIASTANLTTQIAADFGASALNQRYNSRNWQAQNIYNQAVSNFNHTYNSPKNMVNRYIKAGLNPNLLAGSGFQAATPAPKADSIPNASPYDFSNIGNLIQNSINNIIGHQLEREALEIRRKLADQQIEESKEKQNYYRQMGIFTGLKAIFQDDKNKGYSRNSMWDKIANNLHLKNENAAAYLTRQTLENLFKGMTLNSSAQAIDAKNNLMKSQATYFDRLGVKALQDVEESKGRTNALYDPENGLVVLRSVSQKAYNKWQSDTEPQRKRALALSIDILVAKKRISEETANQIKSMLIIGQASQALNAISNLLGKMGVGSFFNSVLDGVLSKDTPDSYGGYDINY